jgi:formylglycine-generating enzyme required for sulfatase activity
MPQGFDLITPQKGRIFISYRRTDTAGYAGRIYDRLVTHFGQDAVFMDVDTIEAGLDFVEVLQNAVQSCDVLIALIGHRWLENKDADGKRRLDNPEDFVRIEITAALDRNIRVIPVLVDGESMPYSTELPENLKPLARRNALQVNHSTFNADAHRLISQLELALKAAEDSSVLKAGMLQEEQDRKEKEAREAEERVRLAAAQHAQKEREERIQREAEKKAREDALSKARQREATERIKNLIRGRRNLSFFIAGGIIFLFLLGYLIKNAVTPSTPSLPTEISATDLPSTDATSTELSTEIPLTSTTSLGIGSTMVSKKDGMVMVYVPAGEFQMGSENGAADESPVHAVYLDAFWIDQTEVTNAMYARCVQSGKCEAPSFTKSFTHESYYGSFEFDDYPVIYVSWSDAVAYCNWAGRRLPAEAEWEKAARGTDGRVYPWGNAIDSSYANYNLDAGDTTAVGSFEKGVGFYNTYDMAGNVFEWVADWYDAGYYTSSPDKNPNGPSSGLYRVLRGGSWLNSDFNLRASSRIRFNSASTDNYIGFRCARSTEAP